MKNRWHKADIALPSLESAKPVPIVGDGAIATVTLGEGRMIPVLIIDTSERPDVEDLIKAQEQQPQGDVQSQWGRLSRSKSHVSLVLVFQRPSNVLLILEFDAVRQGILIESILTSKALYIQPGRMGDRLSSTLDNSRILVEVPERGFWQEWRNIWHRKLEKYFRKEGLKRSDAREAARTAISQVREICEFRVRWHSQRTT